MSSDVLRRGAVGRGQFFCAGHDGRWVHSNLLGAQALTAWRSKKRAVVCVCVYVLECAGWLAPQRASAPGTMMHAQPSWPLSCTPPVERGQLEAWRSVQQHCWQLSTKRG